MEIEEIIGFCVGETSYIGAMNLFSRGAKGSGTTSGGSKKDSDFEIEEEDAEKGPS